MQSSDGQTWRRATPAPADDLETVTRIGNRFFATATSGSETVCASTDGVWAAIEPDGGPRRMWRTRAPTGGSGRMTSPRCGSV